ncbi:hypothetical protein SH501x_000979 [Pirellulaceae bacterium SH501]
MSRYLIIAICSIVSVNVSNVLGEELQVFLRKCQEAGISARVQSPVNRRCLIDIPANGGLSGIPPSGDIEIAIVFNERKIDGSTLDLVAKDRRVVSFDFNGCQLTPIAITALKLIAPNRIALNKSVMVECPSERERKNDAIGKRVFEITIKDCSSLLAEVLLHEIGFASRTSIEMDSSFRVLLNAENNEFERLVINGCTLVVQPDFIESSNVSEIAITNSKLSANTISSLLRLKRLSVLSIYKYEIEASEWGRIDLPPKCAKGLVVLTSGRLLDYFKDNLDPDVDLPGRKRANK